MEVIIAMLPRLLLLIVLNTFLGIYNNVGTNKFKFDKNKLITGLIKATIIAVTFIGLAYCFDGIEAMNELGVTPILLMNTSVVYYAGKVIMAFGEILGIKDKIGSL